MEKTTLEVKPYNESYKEEIMARLENLRIATDSNYSKFGNSENPFLRTIIVEQNGTTKGFGSIWKSIMHPNTVYIATYSDESHGNDIFDELLDTFKKIRDDKFPLLKLQTAYPKSFRNYENYYLNRGFVQAFHTYTASVSLDKITREQYEPRGEIELGIENLSNDYLLKDKDVILNLLINSYEANHSYNPPMKRDTDFWRGLYLGADVLHDYSFAVKRGSEIVGILLSRDVSGSIFFEIVSLEKTETAIKSVVYELLKNLIHRIKVTKEYERVSFEIDDNNQVGREIINQLGINTWIEDSNVLTTFREE